MNEHAHLHTEEESWKGAHSALASASAAAYSHPVTFVDFGGGSGVSGAKNS